eukprot:5375827-Pleurochrysis_carterae.AAC.1
MSWCFLTARSMLALPQPDQGGQGVIVGSLQPILTMIALAHVKDKTRRSESLAPASDTCSCLIAQ